MSREVHQIAIGGDGKRGANSPRGYFGGYYLLLQLVSRDASAIGYRFIPP
jgi:hypothetical protein